MQGENVNAYVSEEKLNLRYGLATIALGVAAFAGSLGIYNHNRQYRNLSESLASGAVFVFFKGVIESMEARNRLDELENENT